MTHTDQITRMSLPELARQCAEQTSLFFEKLPHSTAACFELFRRAIEQRDQSAWEAIYRQYEHQVIGWIMRHSQLQRTGEDAAYFVNRAFERFWQGLKPENFANYRDLAALLGYLQMCVHSAIISVIRTNEIHLQKSPLESGDMIPATSDPETEAVARASAAELWAIVESVCQSEAERRVAYATYVLGMAPRQVVARYPNLFGEVKQVNDAKRRLEARLARHPAIRVLLDAKTRKSGV